MCTEDIFYFWGATLHKRIFFYNKISRDLIDITH